jgi:hypothetical protein
VGWGVVGYVDEVPVETSEGVSLPMRIISIVYPLQRDRDFLTSIQLHNAYRMPPPGTESCPCGGVRDVVA